MQLLVPHVSRGGMTIMKTKEEKAAVNKVWRQRPETQERRRALQKARYADHPEKYRVKARSWRAGHPEYKTRKYGITYSEYKSIWDRQRGRCAFCDRLEIRGQPLDIDHSHFTGQVRWLLCRRCNLALGLLSENVFTIKTMLECIRRSNAWHEEDMPEKLNRMSIEQAQLDSLEGGQNVN